MPPRIRFIAPARRIRASILFLLVVCAAVSCGGGGGGGGVNVGGPMNQPNAAAVYVAGNGAANAGLLDQFDPSLNFLKTFDTGANQGVLVEVTGGLVQAADPGASLLFVGAIAARADMDAFDADRDRMIAGANTGLVAPKGIAEAFLSGFVFVADTGAGNVKVFGSAAAGDVTPVAVSPLIAAPWDLAYDEINDRLYVALTNGQVEVFETYVAGGFGQGGANRTITPTDGGGNQISVNLHGIAYDVVTDRLVLSDVGAATAAQDPNFASDGQIFVLTGASVANGFTPPDQVIAGPATLLGNPVDISLDGTELRIAEKANAFLLVYTNLYNRGSGDLFPDQVVAQVAPEALVSQPAAPAFRVDVSDVDQFSTLLAVATVSNPGVGLTGQGEVARLAPDLSAVLATFGSGLNPENLTFDLSGDAYMTFDDGTNANGGILVIGRLARSRDGGVIDLQRDRAISGPTTTLVSPKGLDIADDLGLIFVADNQAAAPRIVVFGSAAAGDVPPLYTTALPARPWDLDYDPVADRMFVALTDGTVAVFDDYHVNLGANPPDRIVTPADVGAPLSVNLHGIVHDAARDIVILSDVGSAADATDGQIFVVPAVSVADGLAQVNTRIAGPMSGLGNPVDISWDGFNLYVAEKSNDAILRFDALIGRPLADAPPDLSIARTKPESVVIVPGYLSATP